MLNSVAQQTEEASGGDWLRRHYRNLKGDYERHEFVASEDTLGLERLLDAWLEQRFFDVMFLRYEDIWEMRYSICCYCGADLRLPRRKAQNRFSGSRPPQERRFFDGDILKRAYSGLNSKLALLPSGTTRYRDRIGLVHVVNTFCTREGDASFLDVAQPITLRSMAVARDQARRLGGIEVDLVSAVLPGDEPSVTEAAVGIRHLQRSLRDEFPQAKAVPYLQDMLDVATASSDAEYVIISNADIILHPEFYIRVREELAHGARALSILRVNNLPKRIDGRPLSPEDLPDIYNFPGQPHPGYDCFVLPRGSVKNLAPGGVFIAYPPWGASLRNQLKLKFKDKFWILRSARRLTFHLGWDRPWIDSDWTAENKLRCHANGSFRLGKEQIDSFRDRVKNLERHAGY